MDDPAKTGSRQFSVRTLFGVTSAVAVLMGLALAILDQRCFRALWSYHAVLATVPIIGVWIVPATGLVSGRRLAFLSLAVFGVALLVPALRFEGMGFGWQAFGLSFFGTFVGIYTFPDWRTSEETCLYLASTIGAVANVIFLVGYVSFVTSVIWGRGLHLARWSASIGSCLALLVVFPMCLGNGLNSIYIGYGLWIAAMVALALGSWTTSVERGRERSAF